jgi:hypothetical protein
MQELPIESIWLTYFTKHFDSVVSFIRKRNQGKAVSEIVAGLSEPIDGRILDMINYLAILRGMILEERGTEREEKKVVGKVSKRITEQDGAAVAAQNIEASKSGMAPGEFSPFFYRTNPER